MNEAKDYLLQIHRADLILLHLRREIAELRSGLLPSAITYDADRVQTSPGDPMSETFAKLDDLERQYNAELVKRSELRMRIIIQIGKLPARYAKLLYLRYVDGMKLDHIARKLQYSSDWVRHLHGEALTAFLDTNREEVDAWALKTR